jgi:hypothetical protein
MLQRKIGKTVESQPGIQSLRPKRRWNPVDMVCEPCSTVPTASTNNYLFLIINSRFFTTLLKIELIKNHVLSTRRKFLNIIIPSPHVELPRHEIHQRARAE